LDSHLWWHLARASGLTAWLLLSASVLWGLFLSTRVLGGRAAPAWLLGLHRSLGALTVVFTAVHMVGLGLDSFIGYGPAELFVPLESTFEPWAVAWGIVSMYLLVAVAVTSWLRRWIPDVVWRWVHRTAFVTFVLATLHTFQAGTDSGSPYLVGAAVVVCAVFLFLCVYRVLAGRRQVAPRPTAVAASTSAVPTEPAPTAAAQGRPSFHGLRVREVRPETADSVSVAFDVPDGLASSFRFDPGQFITLRKHIDGAEVRRSYSICSGIADGELRVAVRRVPGGVLSGWITEDLRDGEVVDVLPPQGRFTTELNPLKSRRVLGVAAGSGITPVLSILRSVLTIEPRSTAVLVLGNRDPGSIMLAGELEAVEEQARGRLTILPLFSRHDAAPDHQRGRIEADRLRQPDFTDHDLAGVDEAYLCGPTSMVNGVREHLELIGVPADQIHAESFGPAASPAAVPAGAAAVPETPFTVVNAGVSTGVTQRASESVLDAGLREGLDLPYSCMAGSCGTCIARVVDGACDPGMSELDAGQRARGEVLSCQARVTEPGTTIAFE